MADTHVLVPMQLDAMVLDTESSLAMPFLRFELDYDALATFNSPDRGLFSSSPTDPPTAGIYLHWTLPQALRHGSHADGTTTFHLVPNRWLVSRAQAGLPAAEAVKAWLIESDHVFTAAEIAAYQHANSQGGGGQGTSTSPKLPGAAYVDPSGLNENGTITPVRIGRARLLTEVESLDSQPAPFLRAVGPGNVYFSAFEPGVSDVLAFHDPVLANDDQTPIDQATFTYSVVGWYSDAPHDPLTGTTWTANTDPDLPGTYVNSDFPWYLYAHDEHQPTQMLVHAVAPDVPWDRDGKHPSPTGKSSDPATYPWNPATVRVAFGNTAVDALSAIVRLDQNSQTEADLLEAFQYSLLDELDRPGSSEALSMAIRQNWYGASSGGTLWQIVPAERTGDTSLPAPTPPVATADQQQDLATLNAAQDELDRQQRILDSMQWTLFGLWWMNQWQQQADNSPHVDGDVQAWLLTQLPNQLGAGPPPNDPSGTDPTKEDWYAWKVQAQQNLVSQLTDQVNGLLTKLAGHRDATPPIYGDLGPDLQLKGINQPQYFAAQDPVVLIAGLGRATNFDPVDGVLCRLPSQAVASLTIGGRSYGGAGLAGQIPVLGDPRGLLPDGVQVLNAESFFLSPFLFAENVLGSMGQAPAVEQAIQALPKPAAGGQFPPVEYAYAAWQQPWVPLLLDWQVVVLRSPAYSGAVGGVTCTFNQGTWSFGGTDYTWAGPTSASGLNFDEASSEAMTLTGRTFVTPQLAITLARQLDTYVKTHVLRDPNLEALLEKLDAYIDGIAGQDILSQRLSGMLGMMIQRGPTPTVAPSGDVTALLGTTQHGVPMPFPREHSQDAPAVWDFAPLRGTFYLIEGLTVTDAFGRTIDLLLANDSTNPPDQRDDAARFFYPIAGRDVAAPTAKAPAPGQRGATDATQRMLQLTPAPIQPSQLRFRLLSNDGNNDDVYQVVGANPICGWVVPNHLDRSLAFYAPDGTAWGELYLSARAGGAYVPAWQPDPANPRAPQSVGEIPNLYVSAMLQTVWDRTDNGIGFSDFLQVVDETLWSINPPGDRNDHDLAVLVGRPLAIVRAELSLKLSGLPVVNQDWWNLFTPDSIDTDDPTQPAQLAAIDGGVSSFQWPVRLGSHVLRDDGLIGYFVDDPAATGTAFPGSTFNVFDTVTLPAEIQTDYLKQIGPGNYPLLRFVDDSVAAPDPAQQQVCRLTMLVDPRGPVHAFSGLLPVVTLAIPSQYVTPALNTIAYLFRAGPLLTPPDVIRLPRPAETKGGWGWFDRVLESVAPLTPADGNATITATPPLIKEGWLTFTPNPPVPPKQTSDSE